MTISSFVLSFAEILESGALLSKEDASKNVGLNKSDYEMHVIIANILKKSLNSSVMSSVSDDFYVAFNKGSSENLSLRARLSELEARLAVLLDPTPEIEPAPLGKDSKCYDLS